MLNYLQAIITHILASATAGHGSSESFFRIMSVLVYLHRNNKYTKIKTKQKMIKKTKFHFFATRIGP